ncbi:hypothetical protein [Pseudomonas virus PBPA162]|uniref:Uncharacterized protein n=1 Tax=Pseudomonas virus PBPA162 TaxID=2588096 RepID=A0A4Y5TNF2_9CAUD|nr:hypothetical protein PQC32_gp63 [Pseudomonas virus PBPA162]QDB70897.1 hypothetical protein [Pseudomonas virus PBPA162]
MPKFLKLVVYYMTFQVLVLSAFIGGVYFLAYFIHSNPELAIYAVLVVFVVLPIVGVSVFKAKQKLRQEKYNVRK